MALYGSVMRLDAAVGAMLWHFRCPLHTRAQRVKNALSTWGIKYFLFLRFPAVL